MKYSLTFCLAGLAAILTLSAPTSSQAQRMIKIATGTGFFVSVNGDIVTNHHVIRSCKEGTIKVRNSQFDWVPASLKASEKSKDLALLRASRKASAVATLEASPNGVRAGDSAIVIGYPGKRANTGVYKFVKTTIKASENRNRMGDVLEFENVIAQGNSGGPLLDQTGNVIGVVTGYYYSNEDESANNGFAMTLTELKNFLRKNRVLARRSVLHGNRSDKFVERKARDFIVTVRCEVE